MFKIILSFILALGVAVADFTLNPDFILLERTLNTVNDAKGTMLQEVDGRAIKAEFFIKLPSRFKMEYKDDKLPIIILVNSGVLTYYDKKLDQKSQISTPNSIFKLLLKKQLSLISKDLKIINFKSGSAEMVVELSHTEMPEATFKLFFKKTEVPQLYKIDVTTQGQTITTFFENITINTNINNKVFDLPNKKIDAKFNF